MGRKQNSIVSRVRDTDGLVEAHFTALIDADTRTLIAQASYDLYYGPEEQEGFPGWTTAIKQLNKDLRGVFTDVWVDTQADIVEDVEPSGFEDEETGEYLEPDWSDYVYYDAQAAAKATLGELAKYLELL
jgi:hypothetical protein